MEMRKPVICICGGGSLGTVLAGVAASKQYTVHILTGHPERWQSRLAITDPAGKVYRGRIDKVSAHAVEVIPQSDIVLLCLPGSVINDNLKKIKPYLSRTAVVGSVFSCTGFFIMALSVLGSEAKLFGCQRVPFIARVTTYGHTAALLDYRKNLHLAFWGIRETERTSLIETLSEIMCAPVTVLAHALQATLTNSNPILHPSRLYSLFRDFDPQQPFATIPCFYEDWDDDSSRTLIACDNEFQTMLRKLGLASAYTPPLLDYYDSCDAESLTRKITSIASLRGLKVPMIPCGAGYGPDWENRYFTEDIPYGMLLIKFVCQLIHVPTPHIDKIITWYQSHTGRHYLDGAEIANSQDVAEVACLDAKTVQMLFQSISE